MKKMFISVVALAMSVMAMATETAYVEIRLTGNSGLYDEMTLTEDDSYTNAYEDGADAEKIMYQANTRSVLIYGMVGVLPCGDVAAANLDEFEIGFKTNKVDTDYKLEFSNVSGRALKLYDKVAGQVIDITEGGSYSFSVDASLVGQKEINDRFVINLNVTPSLCFNYNVLEINGHAGEKLVVKKGEAEIVSVDALPLLYSKDLSDQKGRLVVTLDGKDFQIDANPDVTPAN